MGGSGLSRAVGRARHVRRIPLAGALVVALSALAGGDAARAGPPEPSNLQVWGRGDGLPVNGVEAEAMEQQPHHTVKGSLRDAMSSPLETNRSGAILLLSVPTTGMLTSPHWAI